jgi:hypothetical protein
MATSKTRSSSARTTKGQQGGHGRRVAKPAADPILAPRVSKIPAQDSEFRQRLKVNDFHKLMTR